MPWVGKEVLINVFALCEILYVFFLSGDSIIILAGRHVVRALLQIRRERLAGGQRLEELPKALQHCHLQILFEEATEEERMLSCGLWQREQPLGGDVQPADFFTLSKKMSMQKLVRSGNRLLDPSEVAMVATMAGVRKMPVYFMEEDEDLVGKYEVCE